MEKSPDAFRTISEVADWLGVQAHVLRFWESKFAQVKPVKRAGGRRYYRPADMLLLGGIKKLLHDDGMTIKGVQKILREQGAAQVAEMSQSIDEPATLAEAPRGIQRPLPKVVSIEDPPSSPEQDPTDRDAGQIELGVTSARSDAAPSTPSEQETTPDAPEPSQPNRIDAAPPLQSDTPPEDTPAPVPTFRHRATPTPPPADVEPSENAEPEPRAATSAPEAPPEVTQEATHQALPETPADPQEPPAPRPRIVDAPDPPPENEIEAAPGTLAALSALRSVPRDDAAEIATLVDALSAWHQAQSTHQTPQ